jgi:hypothetical protein
MLRRPPLRAVLATAAAATVLVGGVNLASYAAGHHQGTGSAAKPSAQPKTIKFHIGSPGATFNGGSTHLFSAKVPKGTYEISMSGLLVDQSTGSDNLTCLVADKKTLTRLLGHPGSFAGAQRLYSIFTQSQADSTTGFGLLDSTNPAVKVDRAKIVYGCALSGTGPFLVARPPVFTLRPVKVTNKSGHHYTPPVAKVQKLTRALR